MAKNLLIGEVAAQFGLTVPTIRYYDQEGLIPNLQKNESGQRVFTAENIDALQIIECLKDSGMAIKDIKQFMQWVSEGDETLYNRREMFVRLRAQMQEKMNRLQQTMHVLDYKVGYYSKAVQDGTEKYVKQTAKPIAEIING